VHRYLKIKAFKIIRISKEDKFLDIKYLRTKMMLPILKVFYIFWHNWHCF